MHAKGSGILEESCLGRCRCVGTVRPRLDVAAYVCYISWPAFPTSFAEKCLRILPCLLYAHRLPMNNHASNFSNSWSTDRYRDHARLDEVARWVVRRMHSSGVAMMVASSEARAKTWDALVTSYYAP